jgi:hypothetical protein
MATTIDHTDLEAPPSDAMTVREYAVREGISLGTAYRRIWAGKVEAQQFFGRWLIRAKEVK